MGKNKTPSQRIKREAQRIHRRVEFLLLRKRTKRLWLDLLSKILNTTVNKVSGQFYVLGDSHSNFFGGTEYINFQPLCEGINSSSNFIPFVHTFHNGPATAYNLPDRNSQVKAFQKTEQIVQQGLIPHGSLVMLCFGEIDCRVHLIKQAELQQRPLEDVVRSVIENYMTYADWLANLGFRVACWGVIASQTGSPSKNKEFAAHGSEIDRNKVTKIFNLILNEECQLRKFRFCSIFDHLVDAQFRTRTEYISSDNCHLSQRAVPLLARVLLDTGILKLKSNGTDVFVNV